MSGAATTTRYRVECRGAIGAPPERVYEAIADYRRHHPRFVPQEYFKSIEVLEGGIGAGTRTRVVMRVLGATRELCHVITEPQPGRVLVESDVDGSTVTTFTVDPADGGASTDLMIATDIRARPGIAGTIERLVTGPLLRRIYRKEIANLADYLRAGSAAVK